MLVRMLVQVVVTYRWAKGLVKTPLKLLVVMVRDQGNIDCREMYLAIEGFEATKPCGLVVVVCSMWYIAHLRCLSSPPTLRRNTTVSMTFLKRERREKCPVTFPLTDCYEPCPCQFSAFAQAKPQFLVEDEPTRLAYTTYLPKPQSTKAVWRDLPASFWKPGRFFLF